MLPTLPQDSSPKPAVFFDRDGVINVSPGPGYVLNWEGFRFSPGIVAALTLCRDRGYATVLVTSQQGVGKGLMTQEDLEEIHDNMQEALMPHDAAFDAILACTHLSGSCTCRKPSPEMIYHAREGLNLDLSRSWLVGDHDRDIQMAINAGVPKTIRILSEQEPKVRADFTLESTKQLAPLLWEQLPKVM